MLTHYRLLFSVLTGLLCISIAWGSALAEDDDDDEMEDDEVVATSPYHLAMLETMQQPRTAPPTAAAPSRSTRGGRRADFDQLARAPNMFGDSQLLIRSLQGPIGTNELILASFGSNAVGSRKMSENDKVMPMDRIFFGYNEFHGLAPPLALAAFAPPASSQLSRCTIGFEKTFLDGFWSAEARVAVSGSPDMTLSDTRYDGGTPTALTFYLKHLLSLTDTTALGAGLGVGVPCTSDVILSMPNDTLRYREQTLHLMPYVGFMSLPTDNWFFNGFLQLDFATGENQLDSIASGRPGRNLASLAEQHLLFADLSLGRWLYRDEDAPFLSGLAGVAEIHYLTTLNDSGTSTAVGMDPNGAPGNIYSLSSSGNRIDVVNVTAGLQFQFGQLSNLRVAAVAPLTTGYDRFFDGELQVSFNRQF